MSADDPARPDSLAHRLWSTPALVFLVPPLMWSGNILLARGLNDVLPPFNLAFWRWALALLILLPIAARAGRGQFRLLLQHWRLVLACGGFGIAGYNALAYVALQTVPAINMTVVNSAIPVLIPVFAYIIAAERPRVRQIVGILLSMAGVVWIIARGNPSALLSLSIGSGELWVLASIINWAIYTVILRYRPPGIDMLVFLVGSIIAGLLVLFPFLALEIARGAVIPLTPQTIAAVAYVAVFASVAAFLCWSRSVVLVGSTTTGLSIHLIPVIVGALSMLVLGEPLLTFHLIGAAFIAAGLIVAMARR